MPDAETKAGQSAQFPIPWSALVLLPFVLVPLLAVLGVGVFLLAPAWLLWPLSLATITALLLFFRQLQGPDGFGPLFRYDLLRLSRKKRNVLVRMAFVAALGVGLACAYASWFSVDALFAFDFGGPGLSPQGLAEFTHAFGITCWMVQNLAILILTPAYVAGAIAEETERRTLPLLFTTQLTDRDIVFGKLFARLGHLFLVLIAGLPLLAITQVWGGLSLDLIALAYLGSVALLLGVGGISIVCSVNGHTVFDAIVPAYGLTLAVEYGVMNAGFVACAVLLPTAVGGGGERAFMMGAVALFGLSQLGIFAFCLATAVKKLRTALTAFDRPNLSADRKPWPKVRVRKVARLVAVENAHALEDIPMALEATAEDLELDSIPIVQEFRHEVRTRRQLVPMGDNALLWKEAYCKEWASATRILQVLFLVASGVVTCLVFFVCALYVGPPHHGLRDWSEFRDACNVALRIVTILATGMVCTGVAFRTAVAFCGERERKTLTDLLLLPCPRWEILWAKWLGAILRWRLTLYALAGVWILGVATTTLHPVGALLCALSVAASIAFVASLGLWLSLAVRRTVTANFLMALALFCFFCAAWMAIPAGISSSNAFVANPWERRLADLLGTGLNPTLAWWKAGFTAAETHTPAFQAGELVMLAAGQVLILAIAAFLGISAWWMLERERGPRPKARPS